MLSPSTGSIALASSPFGSTSAMASKSRGRKRHEGPRGPARASTAAPPLRACAAPPSTARVKLQPLPPRARPQLPSMDLRSPPREQGPFRARPPPTTPSTSGSGTPTPRGHFANHAHGPLRSTEAPLRDPLTLACLGIAYLERTSPRACAPHLGILGPPSPAPLRTQASSGGSPLVGSIPASGPASKPLSSASHLVGARPKTPTPTLASHLVGVVVAPTGGTLGVLYLG